MVTDSAKGGQRFLSSPGLSWKGCLHRQDKAVLQPMLFKGYLSQDRGGRDEPGNEVRDKRNEIKPEDRKMGRGWLDFRSREEKERDYREFTERVFPGGVEHKKRVRDRLKELLPKEVVTYVFMYYVALKDLMVRRPTVTYEEAMRQVCSEIRVLRMKPEIEAAIRQVLEEDQRKEGE